MDIEINTKDNNVRKIEDVIDIQKANDNFRQVAFKLPSEVNSNVIVNLGVSLETGLTKVKTEHNKKKERLRQKNQRESDVISWPSDSDITVLRMKLRATDVNKERDSVALGDGLHQPQSSSMVNLATLMLQSQQASKHNLDVEEYLLPLTSWGHDVGSTAGSDDVKTEKRQTISKSYNFKSSEGDFSDKDDISDINTKSKVARFLRLYFCPCCTCLYKIEKVREKKAIFDAK